MNSNAGSEKKDTLLLIFGSSRQSYLTLLLVLYGNFSMVQDLKPRSYPTTRKVNQIKNGGSSPLFLSLLFLSSS